MNWMSQYFLYKTLSKLNITPLPELEQYPTLLSHKDYSGWLIYIKTMMSTNQCVK
jgi:hypothetical protein